MDIPNALRIAYFQTNNKVHEAEFNINSSGSTCVSLVSNNDKLYSANVGDSRAIICSITSEGKIIGKPLTRDHKPSDPVEAKRIIESGGRITTSKGSLKIKEVGNGTGPLRVWRKEDNTPGLSMTRAIGDSIGSQAGIISEPGSIAYKTCRDICDGVECV